MNMSDEFTKAEAEALIGKTFECLIEHAGLPKGTRGLVVGADRMGEGYSLVIQWELQLRSVGIRTAPLRDWVMKEDVQEFLQEVQP